MKTFTLAVLVFVFSITGGAAEIIRIPLFDGTISEGKLHMPPGSENVRAIVIYVHGTGPATYDDRRKFPEGAVNYFDPFAEEFNRRGLAFFTYNKRGVTIDDKPPRYEKIDREKFREVVPSIEVKDISNMIAALRKRPRLKKSKFVLLGWSEGSVIAPIVAEDKRNKIAAVFLNGYMNENMSNVIKWQNTGGSAMVNMRAIFDKNKDGKLSCEEYESSEKAVSDYRTRRLRDAKFDQLNQNKDEFIDAADFAIIQEPRYKQLLDAIEKNDEEWIWDNYFHISVPWIKEHFALEANKDRLLRLKIPIYIFHGENDANCPVEGVRGLMVRFKAAGKKNLHAYTFAGHNHDLNYVDWVLKKEMPEGIKKMFETAESLIGK